MNRLSMTLVTWMGTLLILPIQAVYISISAPKVSAQQLSPKLSQEQVKKLAQSITVKIVAGENGGSGILIRKQGQVYTVLTNQHILDSGKFTKIQTPDGKIHQANLVKGINFQGKDLALLQFRGDVDYAVASLRNLSTLALNDQVFAAGFPFEAKQSQSNGFVFTTGQVLNIPKRPFKEGYQIGYSNEIEKGMSGGPILNSQGQVIGINGIHAYPLWGDPYVFEDGSPPTDAERDLFSRYSWGIPIQTFARLAPQYTPPEALSVANSPSTQTLPPIANEVNNISREITVQINVSNTPICNGSGVIIAKHGNTYKVLTAEHVVRNDASCDRRVLDVVTYDGKPHQVKTENNGTVQTLEGVDLAVLQFTSNENYRVATLARRDLEQKGGLVFVSGWPSSKRTSKDTSRLFTVGTLFNKELGVLRAESSVSLNLGYGLVYTNIATAGVSGGPVLDVRGHVIGIHGRVDADTPVEEAGPGHTIQLGYSLGIPISTFLSLVNKVGIPPEELQIYPLKLPSLTNQEEIAIVKALQQVEKPSDNSDMIAWLNYGNQLWRQFKYKEALEAFDHAIQIKPHFYQAWYSR